ncbi:hypothetical protein R53718_MFFEMHAI_01380 [Fructobacillus evanidus]|nr:hypothetical protein R53718_MFFEMHAI_01380 [Fructobacillus sp. LMG 32999]
MNEFTEKEYRKIVSAFEKITDEEEVDYGLMDAGVHDSLNLYTALEGNYPSFSKFTDNWPVTMAIANPLTRDWAHDQFVEKEKEYIWKTKKKDSENDCLILYKIVNTGGILTDFKSKTTPDPITESEMREWGYNPDMFDREEVE